jgi:hypothetical protein
MKIYQGVLIISTFIFFSACTKDKQADIVSASINYDLVLPINLQDYNNGTLSSTAQIDSILSGLINGQIVSTGQQSFDINADNVRDVSFEIIDLHLYNNGNLPDTLDSMAARVIPMGIEVLDNSTYSYTDALSKDEVINDNGNWSTNTCVLGTFANAGNFQGNGDKYLAFRIPNGSDYNYGWVKLNCSAHNETLRIIAFGYNKTLNNQVLAGQID